MLNKIFKFKDFDGHYILTILGIKVAIKHPSTFKYKPATEYGITVERRTPQYIVSLTSFPARINTAHLAINTLLQQTFKPDRIILWLASEQFAKKEKDLPQEILKLVGLGLEIKWTEDLKSYKKLLPALKEYPEDIIITADDDIYYEKDWLETLYNKHIEFPKCVVCQRPRRIELIENKIKVLTSRKSENIDLSKPDYFNQMLGGTGCLYPPHSLHSDIFDIEKINRLLPTNDDIYFWAMAVLNETKVVVAKGWNGNINFVDNMKSSSLGLINGYLTDVAKCCPFDLLLSEYPELLKKLKDM